MRRKFSLTSSQLWASFRVLWEKRRQADWANGEQLEGTTTKRDSSEGRKNEDNFVLINVPFHSSNISRRRRKLSLLAVFECVRVVGCDERRDILGWKTELGKLSKGSIQANRFSVRCCLRIESVALTKSRSCVIVSHTPKKKSYSRWVSSEHS